MFYVYVLECADNKYYVGETMDIDRRWEMHKSGRGSGWTRIYEPIRIKWYGRSNLIICLILSLQLPEMISRKNSLHTKSCGYKKKEMFCCAVERSTFFQGFLDRVSINPVGAGTRNWAIGMFRSCLNEFSGDWYDKKLLGKNWALTNIYDNHAYVNANVGTHNATTAADVDAKMLPCETVAEDWTNSDGEHDLG
ncbi:14715_t:CDS:2 [Entrophospora sp. SA101]|nr:14715_t:CDS:2 [Entrophospora sp. SA101]